MWREYEKGGLDFGWEESEGLEGVGSAMCILSYLRHLNFGWVPVVCIYLSTLIRITPPSSKLQPTKDHQHSAGILPVDCAAHPAHPTL